MDPLDLRDRFQFHPADTADKRNGHAMVRAAGEHLALSLSDLLPGGREASLAITHLEQSMMWANAAQARGLAADDADALAREVAHLVDTDAHPETAGGG
jgi:hypothetical protein